MNHNELEMRAGDFGWIVSADALYPDIGTLRDVTAALRLEAVVERQAHVAALNSPPAPCPPNTACATRS